MRRSDKPLTDYLRLMAKAADEPNDADHLLAAADVIDRLYPNRPKVLVTEGYEHDPIASHMQDVADELDEIGLHVAVLQDKYEAIAEAHRTSTSEDLPPIGATP